MQPLPQTRVLPVLLVAALSHGAAAQVDPLGRSILFIRGADNTGGGASGGDRTAHLSDLYDDRTTAGNSGFGMLRQALIQDGFQPTQLIESATPLTTAVLLPHRVVVMGSNNKLYPAAEVQAFHAYLDAGGSALFISDANWGPNWGLAANSDNAFLLRYGLEVYQDNGTVQTVGRVEPGRWLWPDHAVLSGPDGVGGSNDVDVFDGEGVSMFRISAGSGGWQAASLVSANGFFVRLNTVDGSPGGFRAADASDSILPVIVRGAARLAGHFDRNTFFNQGGAGTDITRWHNRQLALDLFRFLASVPARSAGRAGTCGQPPSLMPSLPILGRVLALQLTGAPANAPGLLFLAPGTAQASPLPGGCTFWPRGAGLLALVAPVTSPAGSWQLPLPLPMELFLSGAVVTAQVAVLVPGGAVAGVAELSEGQELLLGYPQ